MKLKKSLIFLLLAIFIFSIACVCASDVEGGGKYSNIQIGSSELESVVATEETSFNENTDVIASNEDDSKDVLASYKENDQDILSRGKEHSFSELQTLIDQANESDEINLHYDYTLAVGESTININKSLTINGNGHTLDGVGLKRILNINRYGDLSADPIILKNIKFVNGGEMNKNNEFSNDKGGAICVSLPDGENIAIMSNDLILINCDFKNNGASSAGGAIYWRWGSLTIIDSEFKDNTVEQGNGGAIDINGPLTINNSRFVNNKVKEGYVIADAISKWAWEEVSYALYYFDAVTRGPIPSTGGAIHAYREVNVENSYFSGNEVGEANQIGTAGGAIHCHDNITVRNCTFDDNKAYDKMGGAIVCQSNDDSYIYDSTFSGNVANSGGAVATKGKGKLHIYNSEFSKNCHERGTTWKESISLDFLIDFIPYVGDLFGVVDTSLDFLGVSVNLFSFTTESKGGAIYSDNDCYIESCNFNNNHVTKYGGAVYSQRNVEVIDSIFTNNNVYLTSNKGTQLFTYIAPGGGYAGAICSNGDLNIANSSFLRNYAADGAGALSSKNCNIYNSTFSMNIAEGHSGAIYAITVGEISNTTFTSNKLENFGNNGGAIVISGKCTPKIENCEFLQNYAGREGGAIYVNSEDTTLTVSKSIFAENVADGFGGAISCNGKTNIYYSIFEKNTADFNDVDLNKILEQDNGNPEEVRAKTFYSCGGAVYSKGKINVENSEFNNNVADSKKIVVLDKGSFIYNARGGAICTYSSLSLKNSNFTSNSAHDGGAVYANVIDQEVSNSIFKSNKATQTQYEVEISEGSGGAVYINSKCSPKFASCTFEQNTASAMGGAIYTYSDSPVKITSSKFISNSAKSGGAVYAKQITEVSNGEFRKNKASDDGGAVYIKSKCSPKFASCTFEQNTANDMGGAIYTDSDSPVKITGSKFISNSAKSGGAVYAKQITEVSNGEFRKNKASDDGGAVYIKSKCSPNFASCTFEENTANDNGGAIYTDTDSAQVKITGSKFITNSAKSGGAVYAKLITEVSKCEFHKNTASDDGGAVHVNANCNPYFHDCTFEGNSAGDKGGAIYTNSKYSYLKLYNCVFKSNSAKSGGAVFAHQLSKYVTLLTFTNNKATSGNGGALYVANDHLTDFNIKNEITKCTFDGNTANNGDGGAIFYGSIYAYITKLDDCTFTSNSAKKGGAVFAHQITRISGSKFRKNKASDEGGALFIKNDDSRSVNIKTTLSNSVFEENTASNKGGGLRMGSLIDKLAIEKCEFNRNSAGEGGGVYANKVTEITNTFFIGNKATAKDGDGGGIYIAGIAKFKTYSCRYEYNEANNRGGAIYTNSISTHIGIDYCTFVHNKANHLDYKKSLFKRYPGHSVYNSGGYDSINLCWFGKNNPDTTNQMVKHNALSNDKVITPTNILKVGMKVSNNNPLVDNPYTVTIYFSGNGLNFANRNLYHSNGRFDGDPEFSNVKANVNDITGTFVVKKAGTNNIYGYIDDQKLSLTVNGKNKDPSTVQILSCEDVKYPNALNVTYQINPMSASTYVIKDAQGEIVKTGNLTDSNTAYIEGLAPGSYSITISNTETWDHFAGSDTKTFNISRGDIEQLKVVVYNKTYPKDVECTVYASVDGEYNLTVANATNPVTVRNGIGYINIGTLKNDTYEATVYFAGNEFYDPSSNSTAFVVYPGSATYFVVNLNASEIYYGQTAVVTHELPENATGNIAYYLSDGTFLGELPVNETLTLPMFEAGVYVIIANYTGDEKYLSEIDNVRLIVNKVAPEFDVNIINGLQVSYGQTAVVNHTLTDNATGSIKYYLSNGTFLGKAPVGVNFNLPAFDSGIYVINANYTGDRNFLSVCDNVTLIVSKFSQFKIDVNASEIEYGQAVAVTHELPNGAEGTIKYYLPDGTFIGENSVNEDFVLEDFDVGSYEILAIYSGDKNYESSSDYAYFHVNKTHPDFSLNITANETKYGETPSVLPLLPVGAGGNVSYYLSNGTYLGNFSVIDNLTVPIWDVGVYEIIGVYAGDNNYFNATANITLTVNKAKPAFEVDVNASESEYNQSNFVSHELSENATGNIAYYLSNGTFLGELTVSENFTLPLIDVGSYLIIAKYSGDKNFQDATANTTLTVSKTNSTLTVDNIEFTYNSTGYSEISFTGATGVEAKVIGHAEAVVNVANAIVAVSNLNVGNYTLSLTTISDKNHYNVTKTANITVNKVDSTLTIDNVIVDYGETTNITVTTNGTSGITAKINETDAVVDGNTITIPILDTGKYTLTVTTIPDNNHNSVTKTANITVNKVDSTLSVENIIFDYNSAGSAAVSFTGASGIDALVINQPDAVVDVKDNTITVSNLNAGKYTLKATTIPDNNHNPVTETANITVNKIGSEVTIEPITNISYGDTVSVKYSIENRTDNVSVIVKTIDGTQISADKIIVGDEAVSLVGLDADNYTISIINNEDKNTKGDESSGLFNVAKFSPSLDLKVSDISYGEVEVITVTCDVSSSVNVTVNNVTETLELNGQEKEILFASVFDVLMLDDYKATLSLSNLGVGKYPVSVVLNGNENFESVTLSDEFEVNSINATMNVEASDINFGDVETITVTLPDDARGYVTINVAGETINESVDNGKAIFELSNLKAGAYEVSVSYSGDDIYLPANDTVEFEVSKVKSDVAIEDTKIDDGKIVITLPSDATGSVTIEIDGKSYTAPVKDGKAVFDVPGLSDGKHDIKVYYSGDEKYNATEFDAVITVESNHADNHHEKATKSIEHVEAADVISNNATGNPLFVLLLALLSIGTVTFRRFKP